jgi:large subunit ribosomal protein L24
MTKQYSKHWKNTEKAAKQRKYRDNAPQHIKDKFLNARATDELQDEHDVKQLRVRIGDTVRIERGDYAGIEGDVRTIDRDREQITVDGAEQDAIDGSAADYPIHPSNVTITELSEEDNRV